MTPRQKRIVYTLAIADIAIILVLAVLVTRPSSTSPSPLSHSPIPPPPHFPTPSLPHYPTPPLPHYPTPPLPHARTPAPIQQTCQQATQLLAQAGLGGTVTLTSGNSLRFEITQSPSHPVTQSPNEAAQSVWTAFDVALALQEQEDECATFTQVEVTILAVRLNAHDEAHSGQTDAFSSWQIYASVSAADLEAFSAGELSENEFIERVTYTTSVIRNE